MTDTRTPWGRVATLVLGIASVLAGQIIALMALTWWYGRSLVQLPDFSGDGTAIALVILVSTPIQIALLVLFAYRRSPSAADYLGLVMPRRSDVIVGLVSVIALIIVADTVSWLLGRAIVTPFQNDIYRTADTAGVMALLWLAVVIGAPAAEEVLFRGFLFRGWLRQPRDAWPVVVVTALLFALLHVQYDAFVMAQIFLFGLLLGFMRWASGSTILTFVLHAVINLEGMIETWISFNG